MQYIQGHWASQLQKATSWCHWHRCHRMLPWILYPCICSGFSERGKVWAILSILVNKDNWPPPSGRSTWTIVSASHFHITWKAFPWPWWCTISCANMECTFRSGWIEALSSPSPILLNCELALAFSIFMATRIHAYLGIHQAISLVRSRWTVKSSRPCGHHWTMPHGASVGCLWFIDRRFWTHTWTTPIGRSWFALVCCMYISDIYNTYHPNTSGSSFSSEALEAFGSWNGSECRDSANTQWTLQIKQRQMAQSWEKSSVEEKRRLHCDGHLWYGHNKAYEHSI